MPDLIAGIVLGTLMVTIAISLATLIYGAALPTYLDRAIGLTLLSTLAVGLVTAALGSLPGVVSHAQDAPAAVIASAAAGTVSMVVAGAGGAESPGGSLTAFVTVVATVALTTLLTGAVLLTFGLFRLGRMVRYLPYPVVGGFMAGTGWLLFIGGMRVMSGGGAGQGLRGLLQPDTLFNWLPGLVFAVGLLVASRKVRNSLAWPLLILLAVALFYCVVAASGRDLTGWRSAGYLLGPFPDAGLLEGLAPANLALVEWPAVMAQAPTMLTVAGLSLLAVLLSSTAIELSKDRPVDLNRELRATGLGNLLAGSLGGQVGYHSLSLTALNTQVGGGRRSPPLIALGIVALTVLLGAPVLDLVPTFVVGGLIAFLGLSFLYQWLIVEYRRLSFTEYAVVAVIMVGIAVIGFLPGVALGLVLTVVLFVVSYSRVDAVRHTFNVAQLRSRVRREVAERRELDVAGRDVLVLQLQGFLFFGTTNAVLERIQARRQAAPLRAVVLDFKRVTGIDASAALALRRLLARARPPADVQQSSDGERSGFVLYLTELNGQVLADFERRGLARELPARATILPSLDEALEASEATVLTGSLVGARPSPNALITALGPGFDLAALTPFLSRLELGEGQRLIEQGDEPDAIYIVDSGRVSTWVSSGDGPPSRLESMRSGSVVGEIGFFTGERRSATVLADEPTTVYVLSRDALTRLSAAHPTTATALITSLAKVMADRIRHLMSAVDALQR